MTDKGKDIRPDTMMVNGDWQIGAYRYKAHGLLQEFVDSLKDKKLLGSLCDSCGKVIVPLRRICGRCHKEMDRRVVVGEIGTVTGYLASQPVEKGKFKMFGMDPVETGILKAGEILMPVFVKFDGADSNFALVLNEAKPEEVHIGMRVRVQWAENPLGHLSDILGVVPLKGKA